MIESHKPYMPLQNPKILTLKNYWDSSWLIKN